MPDRQTAEADMRYSLRIKLTAILIIIVSCVIFITWLLNLVFAEQFYRFSEKRNIIATYHEIEKLLAQSDESEDESDSDKEGDGSQDQDKKKSTGSDKKKSTSSDKQFHSASDRILSIRADKKKNAGADNKSDDGPSSNSLGEVYSDILRQYSIGDQILTLCNQSNIRVMVMEADSYLFGQNVLYTNLIEGSLDYEELLWYLSQIQTRILFGSDYNDGMPGNMFDQFPVLGSDEELLSELTNKGYAVRMDENRRKGRSGIYLFGYPCGKYLIAMTIPLESIKTSARISSRFLLYMGLIGIIIGSIAVLIVSGRFTSPIKEMAGIADKMAQLDFDAKIRINTRDELELLGNSMNTLSETLESTIADLKSANLELQKDIEKKEQIDEMRKEFLSHVSHELKTPIALIQGYAEGLSENIMDDEESKEFYCEVISDEAHKMNIMVQKLLTLNQIEFGNTQIELQRFDICQLIRNKIQSSRILLQKNGNTVEFDCEGPVYVWADEFMIEEVFSNYFSNAIHHVTPGGLIRVWLEKKDTDVRVHVFNEGSHIPEEDLEKLWIKFYKVDKARTREYGGSGIGLSIVAATMNAHGKEFGVSNVEGGVDFYFDLDIS